MGRSLGYLKTIRFGYQGSTQNLGSVVPFTQGNNYHYVMSTYIFNINI